jgi:phosphoribosylanthranilate isomerase
LPDRKLIMRIQTKICGLSTPETLDAALKGGASHVGLVFFAKSPRSLTPEKAASLAARVQGKVKVVGLFVDPTIDDIDRVRAQVRLDIIQLHGDERPETVSRIGIATGLEIWKAIPVRGPQDLCKAAMFSGAASLVLYDAKPPAGADLPGGNGLRFDWELLRGHRHSLPWALSGGLDASNIAEAVRITTAPLLDVSSGVETAPGVKDVDKIAAFLKAASTL